MSKYSKKIESSKSNATTLQELGNVLPELKVDLTDIIDEVVAMTVGNDPDPVFAQADLIKAKKDEAYRLKAERKAAMPKILELQGKRKSYEAEYESIEQIITDKIREVRRAVEEQLKERLTNKIYMGSPAGAELKKRLDEAIRVKGAELAKDWEERQHQLQLDLIDIQDELSRIEEMNKKADELFKEAEALSIEAGFMAAPIGA